MIDLVFLYKEGKQRRGLTNGSVVYFFENQHQQFCNTPNQGIVEEVDSDSQEVTVRTFDGKIYKNICLERVYL